MLTTLSNVGAQPAKPCSNLRSCLYASPSILCKFTVHHRSFAHPPTLQLLSLCGSGITLSYTTLPEFWWSSLALLSGLLSVLHRRSGATWYRALRNTNSIRHINHLCWHEWGMLHIDHSLEVICELAMSLCSRVMGTKFLSIYLSI